MFIDDRIVGDSQDLRLDHTVAGKGKGVDFDLGGRLFAR